MQPTKDRNHSSFVLSYKAENILFDCGEGTQRQMKISGFKAPKLTKLLISHWHGDHVLGIPGLMMTLGANSYSNKLQIFGPKGTKENIKKLLEVFAKSSDIIEHEVFEFDKDGKFFENELFSLEAYKLDHKMLCFGFKFIEKDKKRINVAKIKKLKIPDGPLLGKLQSGKNVKFNDKIINSKDVTYTIKGKIVGHIADTAYCSNCLKIAEDCDMLISEATYTSNEQEKAIQYKHLTAEEAANIANQSNVKKLVLYHFSQRYKDYNVILEDAKNTYQNVIIAHDFLKIKV